MRSHSKLEHVGRVYVAAAAAAVASRRSFLYSSKTSSHVNSSWSAFWATKTMASKSSGLSLVRRSLSVAFAKLIAVRDRGRAVLVALFCCCSRFVSERTK